LRNIEEREIKDKYIVEIRVNSHKQSDLFFTDRREAFVYKEN